MTTPEPPALAVDVPGTGLPPPPPPPPVLATPAVPVPGATPEPPFPPETPGVP